MVSVSLLHFSLHIQSPDVDAVLDTNFRGENNMGGLKGSAEAHVGYSCNQKALVNGWRKIFSGTSGTTDASAPFGIVTLASSGSEGGPNVRFLCIIFFCFALPLFP